MADAAPATPARIGRNGPPIAHVLPPPRHGQRLVDYLAVDAEPEDWFRVMRRADDGDTGPMMDLFSDARDRDSHFDGLLRKRVQSLMGRPMVFRPPEGFETNARAREIAAKARTILLTESRAFRAMLAHLMTGAPYGYAVSPIRWATNRDGFAVPHLQWAHPNRFAFHRETKELGFYAGAYRGTQDVRALSEYPDLFVAHVPMGGRSDYPWRRGPARSCIIPSFIKRQGLRFWLTLTERFGMPQPYARVERGVDHDGKDPDDTIGQVEAALLGLSQHWSAVFGKDIEIDSIPGSGSVRAEVHKELIDWAEMTQSIALLGQNLSTKVEGGSFAAAEAHRFVAADLHLADAVELAETITQQIIEPVVRYNWPGEPVPVCVINTGHKTPFSREDVEQGIASPDEYRRDLGQEDIADGSGAELRDPPIVQVPANAPVTGQVEAEEPEPEPVEAAEEPAAGEVIEVEEVAPDEAVAKDPSTGLNGAQYKELKQTIIDVGAGLLPKSAALSLITASFPISREQAADILSEVEFGSFRPTESLQPEA